jgi:hypothetical protein
MSSDFPKIISIVHSAISELIRLKPKTVEITHHGRKYLIWRRSLGATERSTRPFRKDFVDFDEYLFEKNAKKAFGGAWNPSLAPSLERFVYTAQQVLGCYLDFFYPSAAPRVAGTVFECLIACGLNRASGFHVGPGTVRIPLSGASIQTDLGIKQDGRLTLLVATKTSTRERLSQPFVQKYIVDHALKKPPKTILIVIGDVQRLGHSGVQHTFTAGQFQLYWKYLTPMDGVYYIDVPPQAETKKFGGHIKRLRDLFASDIKRLV